MQCQKMESFLASNAIFIFIFTILPPFNGVTTIDYVPPNVGTFLLLEREQNWQMAHSLWQAPRPGTSYTV